MKKHYLLILIIFFIFLIFYFNSDEKIKKACINEKCFNLYLVETSQEKQKGLSIFDEILENEGMLFVYDAAGEHSFWMKDMKFNIDIIWIDENYQIVHIEKNLFPCSLEEECKIFSPNVNSKYVLEINANLTEKYNFKLGDSVELK